MHKGVAAFGVILLLIGLVAYFYSDYYSMQSVYSGTYPYRDIGLILILAGLLSVVAGVICTPKTRALLPAKMINNNRKLFLSLEKLSELKIL